MTATDRGRARIAHTARMWITARAAAHKHEHRHGPDQCPICSQPDRPDLCDNPDCYCHHG